MTGTLRLGSTALVDAAAIHVASEFGFAEDECLALDLVRATS
jgi:ABC-type nitrate/sulfonate/bicarbonate transport system substrate-binding protein